MNMQLQSRARDGATHPMIVDHQGDLAKIFCSQALNLNLMVASASKLGSSTFGSPSKEESSGRNSIMSSQSQS